MIEELLPYYEKQLQEFSQQSRDFAQKYPKIAQRLALNQEQIDDPHIERLIQFFRSLLPVLIRNWQTVMRCSPDHYLR